MSRLQKYYFILAICFFASVTLVSVDEGDAPGGAHGGYDSVTLLLEMITYGVLFVLCIVHRHKLVANLKHFMGPLPLVLLCVASTLWSIDPGFTLRRSIVLLCATVFAYYLRAVGTPARRGGLLPDPVTSSGGVCRYPIHA